MKLLSWDRQDLFNANELLSFEKIYGIVLIIKELIFPRYFTEDDIISIQLVGKSFEVIFMLTTKSSYCDPSPGSFSAGC